MAAAAQGAGAQVPQAAPVAPQQVFQLSPASNDSGIIDYTTKEGNKKFERATKALTNVFDGKSINMTVFKGDLAQRASNCGWSNGHATSDVISIPGDNNVIKNLITEYSQLTSEQIMAWANTNIVNQQTRKAQNNENMYQCLYNSISSEVLTEMLLRREAYTVNNVHIAALFYKCIMSYASVDTTATLSLTRAKLAALDKVMLELNSNIKEFNVEVGRLKASLAQYGTQSEDLVVNLFKGYKAARDNGFHEYIKGLERKYLYSEEIYTADQLMSKALTAYQVEFDNGSWGKLSEDQEMLVAMQSELKQLKDKNLVVDTSGGKTKKKNQKKKTSSKKNKQSNHLSKSKEQKDKDNAWKLSREGNAKSKKVNGKTYYWCTNHNNGKGMWTLHQPSECNNSSTSTTTSGSTTVANSATTSRRVTHSETAAAAVATLEDSSSEEE